MFRKPKSAPPSLPVLMQGIEQVTNILREIQDDHAGFKFVLIGSAAYLLHGVDYRGDNPGDIDICVSDPLLVKNEFSKRDIKEAPESSALIGKHILAVGQSSVVTIDTPSDSEFGMNNVQITNLLGVPVLSLVEALKSLYLRNEVRPKDILAFHELIKNNISELHASNEFYTSTPHDFKEAVSHYMQLYSDKELVDDPEMLADMIHELDVKTFKNSKSQYKF